MTKNSAEVLENEVVYRPPRILELDVETAPHLVYAWGLFKETIPIARMVKPGYTICWAAKWFGEKEVFFRSIQDDGEETMLREMWKLLNEADMVVHFNGKKFDMPTLNKEFVQRGWSPPSPYDQIDLYLVTRSTFRFASNKLDFVAQSLGLGAKTQHKGMELWTECMAGDEKAWRVMRRYNVQDVKLLEKLYRHLRGWIRAHPNLGLYAPSDKPTCPNCGSHKLISHGVRRTRTQVYRRYQCQDCGAWPRERLRAVKAPEGVLT